MQIVNDTYYSSALRLSVEQLRLLCHLAGIRMPINVSDKTPYVYALEDYCAKRGKRIWRLLDGFEKELVEICAEAGGLAPWADINRLLLKWGKPEVRADLSPHIWQLLDPKSEARLLFPNGLLPIELCRIVSLDSQLAKPAESYPNPAEKKICRERRIFELRLLYNSIITPEASKFAPILSKKTALQQMKLVGWEDVAFSEGLFCDPENAASIEDMKVSSALLLLVDSVWNPNTSTDTLFAKSLFRGLCRGSEINIAPYKVTNPSLVDSSRAILASELLMVPVGKSVNFGEFVDNLAKKGFMKGGDPALVTHKGAMVSLPRRALQESYATVMLSCLCGLGMADLVWSERLTTPGSEFIKSFELTDFARFLLDPSVNAYEEKPPEGKVIIQPDLKAKVVGPIKPVLGKYFLTDLLSKTPEGDLVLDFQTFARLMEHGMSPEKFKSLFDVCCELSENAEKAISGWIAATGAASIRKAVVIETDDVYLLAEIMNMLGPMAAPLDSCEIDRGKLVGLKKAALSSERFIKFFDAKSEVKA